MFELTIHDSPQALHLVLDGELAGRWVRELELCWMTGTSTIGERALEVDLSGLRQADAAGRDLLARMCRAGAHFFASTDAGKAVLQELTCRAQVLRNSTGRRPQGRWRRIFDKFLTTGARERASTTVTRGQNR